jgi:hypothetical protein
MNDRLLGELTQKKWSSRRCRRLGDGQSKGILYSNGSCFLVNFYRENT